MDIDTSTTLVHRNGDPTKPSFWEQFAPKSKEARERFARALADRHTPSGRTWGGSTQSAPNRRRKRR